MELDSPKQYKHHPLFAGYASILPGLSSHNTNNYLEEIATA
jgi:hypothetical protein